MEVSGQLHAPAALLSGRLSGSQSRSGCGGQEKNAQTVPGLEPQIIQLVAQCYTTELYRLLGLFTVRGFKIQSGLAKRVARIVTSLCLLKCSSGFAISGVSIKIWLCSCLGLFN
jgi:hypothetical protein